MSIGTVTTSELSKRVSRRVVLEFSEEEAPVLPIGDRKRGSNERKNARVTELRFSYFWSFEKEKWVAERGQTITLQQKTRDGWGARVSRNVWGGDFIDPLVDEHLPTTVVTLTEK